MVGGQRIPATTAGNPKVSHPSPHNPPSPLPPSRGEAASSNGSRSGGVALLRPSRSALRLSSLGDGRGQAIGARMHGSAPWKTEETIAGLPRLLVLSAFSRFGGCHLSAPPSERINREAREASQGGVQEGAGQGLDAAIKSRSTSSPWDSAVEDCWHKRVPSSGSTQTGPISSMTLIVCMVQLAPSQQLDQRFQVGTPTG